MTQAGKPFRIAVPDSDIDLLKGKLELTRFPDEIEDAGWDYGAPLSDMKRLVEYWRNGYDWRKHEAALNNELPQFTTDIEVDGHGTLSIHYIHKKSSVADSIPLLFIHGWPGSFLEVRKLLPILVQSSSGQPSFHVVAVSLPGYGFSEAPKKKGFEATQMAEVAHKVVLSLGYTQYVAQGGDWGSMICRRIAQKYGPKYCKAWHTNYAVPPKPTNFAERPFQALVHYLWGYNARDKAALEYSSHYGKTGDGYMKQQSTQPQTLGYSLADSPSGLLGWIYEKLYRWTDTNNYTWADDEDMHHQVLTWVSIYWFSRGGPTASLRIYYEYDKAQGTESWFSNVETPIPTGHSYFPKDLFVWPRRWITWNIPNLVFESQHSRGGHFAAYEVPELLAEDLRRMYGKGGPCFAVVPGLTGYA
ncbi:epoxide hydrolase [Coprinopsis sp. MPI-PUGE-AT-0042]|nr:epoxide hydrolase [Coprinopsis sp. MPI-PUGE-AT-0042]